MCHLSSLESIQPQLSLHRIGKQYPILILMLLMLVLVELGGLEADLICEYLPDIAAVHFTVLSCPNAAGQRRYRVSLK